MTCQALSPAVFAGNEYDQHRLRVHPLRPQGLSAPHSTGGRDKLLVLALRFQPRREAVRKRILFSGRGRPLKENEIIAAEVILNSRRQRSNNRFTSG